MQERPDELPRDVLEAELEVRVLVDRVVAGVERQRADQIALPSVTSVRDHARRVAGRAAAMAPSNGVIGAVRSVMRGAPVASRARDIRDY